MSNFLAILSNKDLTKVVERAQFGINAYSITMAEAGLFIVSSLLGVLIRPLCSFRPLLVAMCCPNTVTSIKITDTLWPEDEVVINIITVSSFPSDSGSAEVRGWGAELGSGLKWISIQSPCFITSDEFSKWGGELLLLLLLLLLLYQ
jgi:hypothetical protein